jgi:hypothetical protein
LRIFDLNLARSLESTLGHVRALGASALAGPALAFSAVGEGVLGAFALGDARMLIGRVTVEDGSPLAGRTPEQARSATDSRCSARTTDATGPCRPAMR